MTDQPGDYYVIESVAWIGSVEGLSDTDRAEGREILAVLLAHHDVHLHGGRVPYEVCLERARREFAPDGEPVRGPKRRDAAMEKLAALPALDATILAAPLDERQQPGSIGLVDALIARHPGLGAPMVCTTEDGEVCHEWGIGRQGALDSRRFTVIVCLDGSYDSQWIYTRHDGQSSGRIYDWTLDVAAELFLQDRLCLTGDES